MIKNIFLILTVTIFLSCCGCNNTTTTIDTGSWIEVEDKTENEKNNSSSDIESNTIFLILKSLLLSIKKPILNDLKR